MFAVYAKEANLDDPLASLVVGERPDPIAKERWVRVKATHASLNQHDIFTLREAAIACADHYLAGQDPMQGYASPLHMQSLVGFPPLWVTVSGSEVLRDDTVEFAARLAREGGTVAMSVRADLPHVWPVILPEAPATTDTISEMAAFIGEIA
ncbi:alpha/beta hydrolase fold domain-containing protein [Rhizobium fabae]|uniref:Acetyl esterase/lipase n=1 Tax=Rhizobium fabae TaxID=573179 RepID=A0A7W6BLZ1_9HYPH|nr:alpha/beta hydrolase fold domain-containing protein [Rhizobium fabae]MBB3919711.1 acetyl esterase/lipase [Rhizobium fabae]RUM05928.1 hypothetical protein EFB14_32445 [Rhizobium fabae]